MDINLINSTDTFLFEKVGSMEGFEYSTTRPVIEDISGPKSSIYITSKFGRRRLSWQSIISSQADRRLLLQACRQQGLIKTIEFSTCDGIALEAEIEIASVVMPYKTGKSIVLMEAIAPDWRFYSQIEYTNESNAANQTILNNGNEKTDPTFRIYGPFTSVTITNLHNAETFTILFDEYSELGAGEYIDVNVKERTVKLSDGTSIFSGFEGDFITLEPGSNLLQFSKIGGDSNTRLLTTWRDAYNGI